MCTVHTALYTTHNIPYTMCNTQSSTMTMMLLMVCTQSRKFSRVTLTTPSPITIEIPYIDSKGNKQQSICGDTDIFLGSDWLRTLSTCESTRLEFEAMFGLDDLERFGDTQDLSHDKFTAIRHTRNVKTRCIPICLHGDGAEFQDRDSLTSVSMNGLLKEGCTLDTSLLLVLT